jgi:hypothetical protein
MPDPNVLQTEISTKAKEIHTDAYPMSIGELMSIYRDGEIDIHPEFQRFFRWSDLQKSKFIESILLGIPIPSIFVSQREDGVWDVVDGVQRLSTIFQFTGILRDKDGTTQPRSVLVGTGYLPCLEGMLWQDDENPEGAFPNSLRLFFKRQKLDLKIIKKESDEDAKYDLFERLNTLGSKLSDQEVRNCLLVMINSDMYRWLEELTAFEPFQLTTALTDRAAQERYDMELVLRFLLLTRCGQSELQNIRDVDAFVTGGMRELATDPAFNQDVEADVFRRTFQTLHDALGTECFRRMEGGRGRGGFLISVFEVVAIGLGTGIRRAPNHHVDADRVRDAYARVGENDVFREFSGSGKSAKSRMPRLVPLGREMFQDV